MNFNCELSYKQKYKSAISFINKKAISIELLIALRYFNLILTNIDK